MSPSNVDYSQFGGKRIEQDADIENPMASQWNKTIERSKMDYSQFGGKPLQESKPQKKAGKIDSALYGAAEGALGVPSLLQYGVNEWSKGLEKAFGTENEALNNLSFEQENPIASYLGSFPESEDETSRRIRTGVAGTIAGAPFGIPGIIAGLVGSQAGQTVREIYGKNGKFENFGAGELAAIGTDIAAGGGAGLAASLSRGAGRTAANQAARAPAIFQQAERGLQRQVAKNTIQGEQNALQNVINSFGEQQVRGFEEQAARVSPDRYSQLTNAHSSGLRQQADSMFRNTQLDLISPIASTPEQGGRALQDAANTVFQSEVIAGERQAYNAARDAAKNLKGKAPKTVEQAKSLKNDILKNNPTPEQQPLIGFLNGLIEDLETSTQATTRPASTLLDASGMPLIPAQEIPASSSPTIRSANDLVDLVQRSNQAVNYGSELRQQSHRLIPIVNTLRQEVGSVLNKSPEAARLYSAANTLHGRNAETWGTRFMRNMRFTENPEIIIGKTKLASNMRNLKQAISDPTLQSLAERLVINQITEGGSSTANRSAVSRLSPELSVNARNSAQQLINVKDPLTTTGGRAAVRNDILKDAAQSISTGKRPEKILDLMQTPKGYNIVQESLRGTPESRRLFSSIERLFLEDIFSSIRDKTGAIDFSKARNILKNSDVSNVVERIGGDTLVRRFRDLERYSNNLERNLNLYKTPAAQSFFRSALKGVRNAGLVGSVLHALHFPVELTAGLGLLTGAGQLSKLTFNTLKSRVLSNPRAVNALERLSTSSNIEQLSKQLPRLIAEIEGETEK